MTRLPDLERQLLEAARARERPRRRWWRIGLLGTSATLVLAASAVGAAQLLLTEGEPVPKSTTPDRTGTPKLGHGDTTLLSLRVPDPDGGLPWGVALARSPPRLLRLTHTAPAGPSLRACPTSVRWRS